VIPEILATAPFRHLDLNSRILGLILTHYERNSYWFSHYEKQKSEDELEGFGSAFEQHRSR
jgi:hypothetical protein